MCVELIKNLVEEEFKVQIIRKTKRRKYVEARAIYYMLLREKGRMSLANISETLDKNHATVLHAVKNLKNWMLYYTNIKNIYETLEKKVDAVMNMHPDAFGRAKSEKEMYIEAYEEIKTKMYEMESKHRALRGRYRFLLSKLKRSSPHTYKTFNELETNNI